MKGVIILVIFILVLSGIFAFKILNPKVNDFEEKVSKEEVRQLLEKGSQVDNYIAKYMVEMDGKEQEVTKIVKGNTIVSKYATMYMWDNLDTKEQILINYERKMALCSKKGGISANKSKSLQVQSNFISFMDSPQYEYNYIKEEKIKDSTYIVIELSRIYQVGGNIEANSYSFKSRNKIWINKDSGIVTKNESYVKYDSGTENSDTYEYDIQLNTVKDEDIEKPSLDGYEIIDIDKKLQQ